MYTINLYLYSYLYLFDWNILKAQEQTFSDPKATINLQNLVSCEVKKDMKLELVETKKAAAIFTQNKKHIIKPATLEDLEDWVNKFKTIMSNS